MEVLGFIDKQFNPCDAFQVQTCLTSYALCVRPSYRGYGIATEMLKARVEMLKAFGLQVTTTMFTTIGSQIAAERAGFEESLSMTYDEITEKFPNFDFSKASSKFLKKFTLKV
jgi:GNAT superfamily N-acetyltransferase